jgi:hypothetical protein
LSVDGVGETGGDESVDRGELGSAERGDDEDIFFFFFLLCSYSVKHLLEGVVAMNCTTRCT